MAELATEILRIVSSTYPASLKKLDSIARSNSPNDLQCWADSNPCQITIFASSVVRALEFCPYALSVVERFGYVTSVRDAMLSEKNTLLDGLLRNARQNENNFEKYSPACLALLSTPLPSEFPAPALLVTFFLRCVDVATKRPCAESIRAIHTLVSSGYGYLAEILTPAQKLQLRERMAGFLSIQDNSVLLLSLATLACIGTVLDSADSGGAGEANKSDDSSRQRGGTREFFSGKKATKVLQLVTNIVIDVASRETCDLDVCVDEIRLATAIASAVGDKAKDSLATNDAVNTTKLIEKIQRPGLGKKVLGEALNFAAAVYPRGSPIPGLPSTVERLSHQSLRDEAQSNGPIFLPPPPMAGTLGTMSSQEYISDLMRSMFLAASSPPPMTRFSNADLRGRVQFAASLSNLIPGSQQLRTAILSCLVTNEFSHPIETFLSAHSKTPWYVCQEWEICPAGLLQTQNELALALCMLLLRAGMYSRKDDLMNLDPSLANALLKKQVRLSAAKHACSAHYSLQSVSSPQRVITLFEASATPEARADCRDWRPYLQGVLLRDANRQNETIITEVGKICRDLETRCEGVEKPLRDEEERSGRLQREVDELRSKLEDEMEELSSLKETLEALERERKETKYQLEDATSKEKEHIAKIQDLDSNLRTSREETLKVSLESQQALENIRFYHDLEMRKVRSEAQELHDKMAAAHESEKQTAKDIADKLAFDHISVLNQRQENIDRVEAEKKVLEEESATLRGALDALRDEKQAANEKIMCLDQELGDLSLELECQKTTVARKDNEIEQLEVSLDGADLREREMAAEIDRLKLKVARLQTLVQELENKLEKTEQDGRKKLEDLETQNNSKVLRFKLEHQEAFHKLQLQLQQTREDWAQERDKQSAENQALTKKINKLHAYQEQKAKETETLARQLLGAMSTSGDLATLLDTASTPSSAEAELQCAASTSPPQPVPAVGGRRRPNVQDLYPESNSPRRNGPKRTKTNGLQQSQSQSQSRIEFRKGKKPPSLTSNAANAARRKTIATTAAATAAAAADHDKENVNAEVIQETPNPSTGGDATDLDLDLDLGADVGGFVVGKSRQAEEEAETCYGGSSELLQIAATPRRPGAVGITASGRLDGDLGSEYDDTETLDF